MEDNKLKFLGKDLDSVFCTADVTLNSSIESRADHNKQLKNILIDNLYPGIYQPRKDFEIKDLQELADSIKQQGIIQPIIARLTSQGYEIIAGERRWRAAKLAGLTHVPVIINALDDQAVFACSLIENLQRQDLNPIEEANAYLRLQQEFYLTHEQIAKLIGKSRSVISNSLRLLFLSAKVRAMLKNNLITNGHARALLVLSHEDQEIVAEKVVNNNMTVRALENYIKSLNSDGKNSNKDITNNIKPNKYWSDILTQYFDNPVSVDINLTGKAKIVITVQDITEFYNQIIE